jgi:hypothetical protein
MWAQTERGFSRTKKEDTSDELQLNDFWIYKAGNGRETIEVFRNHIEFSSYRMPG